MRQVVVDASLAAMWVIPEPNSEAALDRAARWAVEGTRILAPCLLLAELTNALYKRIVRRELDLETALTGLDVALAFPIELREEPEMPARAIELAYRLGRPTTHDCHYLALAEHEDCELWTGDRSFFNAVRRSTPRTPRVRWVGS